MLKSENNAYLCTMKEALDIVIDRYVPIDENSQVKLHLLVADVSPLMEDGDFQSELLPSLSEKRRLKVETMSNNRSRALSIGVTLLLDRLLREQGLCESAMKYMEGEHGKLYEATGRVVFNLSHSGRMAAAATLLSSSFLLLSSISLGLDIQHVTRYRPELVRRIFSASQREQLAECKDETQRQRLFTHLWCRAEAYAKATGDGLQWPLPSPQIGSHFIDFEVGEGYCGSCCIIKECIKS